MEVGFLDNENDNDFFDATMRQTADAIADGIVRTFAEQEKQTSDVEEPGFYMVQQDVPGCQVPVAPARLPDMAGSVV